MALIHIGTFLLLIFMLVGLIFILGGVQLLHNKIDKQTIDEEYTIDLPILWMDEKDALLEELNIKTSDEVDFTNTRTLSFLHIDAVAEVSIDGRECSIIYSSGADFTCVLSKKKVLEIINGK